ncbi:Thermophilic serine proteinase precursor [Bacillus sp. THAF10]|uniref:S8 family serine peptidase n=1 Tax=Bacillus sp. THAF10 TaxID=2587848 RepID=UPI0012693B6B|nr:S8 family serine peptidase [Bacillus sp. THAF10]QFT90662.1 Thermophilic serine proteinase precursor [Bacillus sp. THAF10]
MRKCAGILLSVLLIFLALFTHHENVNASQIGENVRVIIKHKNKEKQHTFANHGEDFEVKNVYRKDLSKIKKQYEKSKEVEYVEEDYRYHYTKVNDPHFHYQEQSFESMNIQQAWTGYTPTDQVTVAVLDSGIDHTHPDLKDTIFKPYNVLAPGSLPHDELGHGTHVAGIVGAKTNNGIGIASIAQNVRMMPIKVGDQHGAYASDIAKGIEYAVSNGAEIINISIAGPKSQAVQDAIQQALSKGVLVVAAAGNKTSETVEYPAGFPGVLSVGASTASGALASFSNFGESVSVVAVGSNVISTYPTNKSSTLEGYAWMDGTSMAAPMVASHAALLKGIDKSLTSEQIIEIIEQSSVNQDVFPVQYGSVDVASSLDYYHNKSRIYGANSLETAVKIAEQGWSNVEESTLSNGTRKWTGSFAILASSQQFADSLAVAPLAYKLDSPIYLTEKNYLPSSSIQSMKKLGVNKVLLVGGEQAISSQIEKKLKENGLESIRISGKTRYDTAAEIGKFLNTKNGEVLIVNGKSFPDALSASVVAANREIPILFVENNWIPTSSKEFISSKKFSKKYLIGGTEVISTNLEKSLNAIRISGTNRYKTNIAVATFFPSEKNGYYFATGSDFKDALAGGLLAAKEHKNLLLIKRNGLDDATKAYLQQHQSESYQILGGRKAIESEVIWKIDKILYAN